MHCSTHVEKRLQRASLRTNIFENKGNAGAMLDKSVNNLNLLQQASNICEDFQQWDSEIYKVGVGTV